MRRPNLGTELSSTKFFMAAHLRRQGKNIKKYFHNHPWFEIKPKYKN